MVSKGNHPKWPQFMLVDFVIYRDSKGFQLQGAQLKSSRFPHGPSTVTRPDRGCRGAEKPFVGGLFWGPLVSKSMIDHVLAGWWKKGTDDL